VKDRGLTDEHFDAVAGHLKATLEELEVEAGLIDEVIELVGGTRAEVLDR
jgi:hemoglobin